MSGACDTVVTVVAFVVAGLVMLGLGYALVSSIGRWINWHRR